MSDPVPQLNFNLCNLSNNSFPVENNDDFNMLLDQAVSGGKGTQTFLDHFEQFAQFAQYLNDTGDSAYSEVIGDSGAPRLTATDGTTTMFIDVALSPDLQPQNYDDLPVEGVASVTMALPDTYNIVEIAVFGLQLAEIPVGLKVTQTLWQALFKPILYRLRNFIQSLVNNWFSIDTSDAALLDEAVVETTTEVAEDLSEEVVEVVAEEAVIAELAIDFSVAAPAFIVLGVLVAVPVLIKALAKTFVLRVQVYNMTDDDFEWTIPYISKGAATVQPQSATIPKVGRTTDSYGDVSITPVVYEADFSYTNTSGYTGIGFVLSLTPTNNSTPTMAAVISIPYIADNVIWIGDPGTNPDWEQVYKDHSGGDPTISTSYGNRVYNLTLSIDALSGNNDQYTCVLRIKYLG